MQPSRTTSFVVVVLIACVCSSLALLPVQLSERQNGGSGYRVFIDSDGRQRFFHGINAVVKGPPWLPSAGRFDVLTSLADADMALLASLGLNLIRLGVMWPGVQPQAPWDVPAGQPLYDEEYLSRVQAIVDAAAAHDIYVLLDMHQDVLSERFCGEGVPLWLANLTATATDSFPAPLGRPLPAADYEHSTGYALPTRQACARLAWGDYYFAGSTSTAFQQLYANATLTQLWGQALAHVAGRFAGHAAVLGVELINEPWTGDYLRQPSLLDPRRADVELLQPAYQTVAGLVRQQNDDVLLFFEGVTWADTGFGFTAVPGGADYANRSVLSFHYYTPPQLPGSQQYDFSVHVDEAASLGCGYMLTETCTVACDPDFVQVMRAADDQLLSWAAWEWKDFCQESNATLAGQSQWAAFGACKTGYGGVAWQLDPDTGSWSPSQADQMTLARAYPVAVAGRVVNVSYAQDPVTYAPGPLTLNFAFDPACSLPTQLFVSPTVFGPFNATVVPPMHLTVDGGTLSFVPTENFDQGTIVTIVVTPTSPSKLFVKQ